ncbi:MAG: MFS transporter [Phycisphaerales bacterium]|nr:MFS transporter [Phycisphaerales bacterium]
MVVKAVRPWSAGPSGASGRSARIALVTLTAINLVNYLDRYLVAGIVDPLKREFGATDADIGLLTSAFLLVYMVASPVFGVLARKTNRTLILAIGVFVWSVATMGGGFAATFTQLLIARALVGIGEAAYSTVGPALLSDHYPPRSRPGALSIFYAAIPVGTALSYIVAGLISSHWGWREVFFAGGIPGIALAFVCLKLREVPRGQHDLPSSERALSSGSIGATIAGVARSRDYLFAVAGYCAFTFAFGALAVWTPNYMQTVRGWTPAAATTVFGGVLVASGFVGTLGGGWAARALGGGRRGSLLLCSGCLLVAIPAACAVLYTTSHWSIVTGLVIASTFSFATQGPVNAVIVNAVDASQRPLAIGMSVLLIHLLGDVPSPWLVGEISDSGAGMPVAMAAVPVAMLVASAIWFVGGIRR